MSYELGSLGTYVSGAGPTIIAMIDAENADAFGRSCVSHLEDKGITGWRVEIPLRRPQRGPDHHRVSSGRGTGRKGDRTMSLIVQKFGGTSVRDAERLRNVAEIVTDTYQQGNDVVGGRVRPGRHHRRPDRQGGGSEPPGVQAGDGHAPLLGGADLRGAAGHDHRGHGLPRWSPCWGGRRGSTPPPTTATPGSRR